MGARQYGASCCVLYLLYRELALKDNKCALHERLTCRGFIDMAATPKQPHCRQLKFRSAITPV